MKLFSKILLIWIVVNSSSVCTPVSAQSLSKQEVVSAVEKIAAHISANYVFEKRGNEIASHLRQRLKEGQFDSVTTWPDFAALCTTILQDYSHDGHLYVRHDPKVVKELSTASDSGSESGGENQYFHSKEAQEGNFGFEEVKILKQNIGYIRLSEINISEKSLPTMFACFEFVAHTRALILDLRDNGGGGSELGAVLESMFLPKRVKLLEFKSRSGQVRTDETVSWITHKKYLNPLFIIINKKTGSAAEALTFALQATKRATVVGQPSAGAANMNSWYVVNNELYVSVSTGAPTLPGTNVSWELKGVQPDHLVDGDEVNYIVRKLGNAK